MIACRRILSVYLASACTPSAAAVSSPRTGRRHPASPTRRPASACLAAVLQGGHAEAAAALVGPGGSDPNATCPDGLTLLELAAKLGQGLVITALIQGGADVDATDARGNTALHKLVEFWRVSRGALPAPLKPPQMRRCCRRSPRPPPPSPPLAPFFSLLAPFSSPRCVCLEWRVTPTPCHQGFRWTPRGRDPLFPSLLPCRTASCCPAASLTARQSSTRRRARCAPPGTPLSGCVRAVRRRRDDSEGARPDPAVARPGARSQAAP